MAFSCPVIPSIARKRISRSIARSRSKLKFSCPTECSFGSLGRPAGCLSLKAWPLQYSLVQPNPASNAATPQGGPGQRLLRSAQVIIVGSIMLTFILFGGPAAASLCPRGTGAYYWGAPGEKALGPAAPWFILAVMLFS